MPSRPVTPDLLVFDQLGVRVIEQRTRLAATDLRNDRAALTALLDEAGLLLGHDRQGPLADLTRLAHALDDLATDVGTRADAVSRTLGDVAAVDELSRQISDWKGTDNDPMLDQLVSERDRLVDALGLSPAARTRVMTLLDSGHGMLEALTLAARDDRDERIGNLMVLEGLDRAAASERVAELDAAVGRLVAGGIDPTTAMSAVVLSDLNGLDVDAALADWRRDRTPVLESLARQALGNALGLEVDGVITLETLRREFDVLDRAREPWTDGLVSRADLEHVVANPGLFAPSQVGAARALLADDDLFDRLDTAAETTDVLAGDRFGGTTTGDGRVSLDDLAAFVLRSQIHHGLADLRVHVDVAADPGGSPDGFISRADLEQVAADPELPSEARSAAAAMIEAGLYDRNWLERHADELVMAAAVAAGATVIVISGGLGTPAAIAVAGASGAAAAAGTSMIVNDSGDARDTYDGVWETAGQGAVVAAAVASLPIHASTMVTGESIFARVMGGAHLLSDTAGLAQNGSFDLLIPEQYESDFHEAAELAATGAGAVAAGDSLTGSGR